MAETTTKTPMSFDSGAYLECTIGGGGSNYARIGKGFTALTLSQNPQVNTVQYIDEENASSEVTALQMQFAYTAERVVGDTVNDFISSLRGKTGSNLKTTLIYVDLWDATSGSYTAVKYNVTIAISNPGDLTGGSTQAMSGTIYVNGDGVEGTFNPTTMTFTEATDSSAA